MISYRHVAPRLCLAVAFSLPAICALLAFSGCQSSEAPKTEDPVQIEKMSKEYEDISKREREGSGS